MASDSPVRKRSSHNVARKRVDKSKVPRKRVDRKKVARKRV